MQRGRSSLNRLSVGLSRLGAGIFSGLQHSQGNALQRSSASRGNTGAAGAPTATNPHMAKAQSATLATASSHSTPGSPAPSAAPLPPTGATQQKSLSAQQLAPNANANFNGVGIIDGQGHDRSNERGVQLNSDGAASAVGAADDADGGLAGFTSTEDVSSDVWPCRLHESIKV